MNKKIRIAIIICCIVIALTVLLFYLSSLNDNNASANDDYVEFLDVGQGDCALISSNGRNCLIDTGEPKSADGICSELKSKNIDYIDLISISHFHADHTGGLYDIIKQFSVDYLMLPKQQASDMSNSVNLAQKQCVSNGGEVLVTSAGQTANIGDFKLSVLYQNIRTDNENNRSVYIMAKIGDIKFFFTGDGGKQSENELINTGANIDCDVLKVAHHGSYSATGSNFLSRCTPEYAVISCGKNNSYGHPHDVTVNALKKRNIKILRTDKSGDIVFGIENNSMKVSTEK